MKTLSSPSSVACRLVAALATSRRLRFAFVIGVGWIGGLANAATYTLTSGSTQGWETANWTTAGFPNAPADIAQYNTATTAATTALNRTGGGSITLGQLLNQNTGNWTITTGTASGIVFDNTGGVGSAMISTSNSGTLTIAPAITILNTNLVISTGINQTGAISITGAIGGTGNLSLTGARAGATMITLGDVNNTGTVSAAVSATGHATTQFTIGTLGANVTALTVGDAANPAFGGRLNVTGTSAFTGPITIQGAATLATSTVGLNGSSVTNGITFGTGGGTLLAVGNIVTAKAITLNGTGNFTTSAGNDITLSGAISGSSGLTKRGNGNLILSGSTSNTYAGDTLVAAGAVMTGQLSLQKMGGAIAVPGDLVMDGTAGNAAGIGSAANTVRNQFGQQFGANSVIRFTNNTSAIHAYFNLYGNDQTVAGISESVALGGIIQISQTEAFGIDAVLTINNSADFSFAGYLRNNSNTGTGTLGIIKTGAGKQTLVGSQIIYTGPTTINQGILELQSTTGFNSAVTFGAGSTGILQLASTSLSINGLASTDAVNASAFVQNASGVNATLTVNQASDTSFGGTLRDNGANTLRLVKTGTGALNLAGNNTHTGGTAINGGVLTVGSTGALGTTGAISFGGGTLRYTAANTTDYSSRFATTANQTFRIDTNGQTITLASNLTSASGFLVKSGTGTLILAGTSAYNFDTTITEGVLQMGSTTVLTSSRSLIIDAAAPAGTTLRLNGFDTTVGTATNSGLSSSSTNGIIENGSTTTVATFTVLSGFASTYAGIIRDGGSQVLNFTRGGGGTTLIFTGANTYTGITTLNSGRLEVAILGNGGLASGIGASSAAAGNLILNGGGLAYGGSAATSTDRQFTLGTAGGTLASHSASAANTVNFTSAADLTFQGAGARTLTLSGSNTGNNIYAGRIINSGADATSLTKSEAGTWILTANHTYTGATTISGGRLVLNGSLTGTAVTVQNGATLAGTGTIGAVSGTTGVTLAGGALGGAIDLQNGTISSITLQSDASTNLLTLGGTAGNAAVLKFDIGAGGTSDQIILNGGKLLVNVGGARVDLNGLAGFGLGTYDLITFGTGQASGLSSLYLGATAGGGFSYSLVQGTNAAQLVVSNTFVSSTWNTNANGSWFTAASWTGSLIPNGTGATATLGNIITAPRVVTVNGVATIGTLNINSAQAYTVNASGGGFLVLNNNGLGAAINVTTGTHTISAPVVLAEDTALQLDGTQLTVSGVVSGSGRLTKTGAGTLVLSGTNTFTGGLSFTDGILRITNEFGFGAIPTVFNASSIFLNNAIVESAADEVDAKRGIVIGAGGVTFKVSNTMFVRGVISGTGSITVGAGGGQYAPAGANTYSGGTILESGSKTVPLTSSIGPADAPTSGAFGTGTLTLAGGQIRATSNNAVTIGNTVIIAADTTFYSSGSATPNDKDLTFTGTTTLTGTRVLTVETALPAGTTGITFQGAIGDGGNNYGLIKAGVSTLVLSGANTFTGGLTIREGTLIATTNAAALGGGGTGLVTLGHNTGTANATLLGDATPFANAITVAAGSSGTATIGNNGTTAAVFSGAVTLNKGLTLRSNGTGSVTLSGALTGAFDLTVTGTGSGFAQLSGNNAAFTGDVNISSGTLKLNSATALNVNNAVAVSTGGTFDINARSVTIEGLNNGTGAGVVTNSGNAATLTLGGSGTYTFGGSLGATTAANFGLLKSGTGTQILTGLGTYTGSTTVNGGRLVLDLGTNTTGVLAATSPLVLGGGILEIKGAASGASTQTLGNLNLT
ncbi:MAG TPA: autotransporter-associated beta strand repeat-containing protein, partial [Verrucomicrobium sp.]|nr:autotransporter-associated beta strand repeat-containing protein [Verrucomicrobium sp.]